MRKKYEDMVFIDNKGFIDAAAAVSLHLPVDTTDEEEEEED